MKTNWPKRNSSPTSRRYKYKAWKKWQCSRSMNCFWSMTSWSLSKLTGMIRIESPSFWREYSQMVNKSAVITRSLRLSWGIHILSSFGWETQTRKNCYPWSPKEYIRCLIKQDSLKSLPSTITSKPTTKSKILKQKSKRSKSIREQHPVSEWGNSKISILRWEIRSIRFSRNTKSKYTWTNNLIISLFTKDYFLDSIV